jgi:hypothetical protein
MTGLAVLAGPQDPPLPLPLDDAIRAQDQPPARHEG